MAAAVARAGSGGDLPARRGEVRPVGAGRPPEAATAGSEAAAGPAADGRVTSDRARPDGPSRRERRAKGPVGSGRVATESGSIPS